MWETRCIHISNFAERKINRCCTLSQKRSEIDTIKSSLNCWYSLDQKYSEMDNIKSKSNDSIKFVVVHKLINARTNVSSQSYNCQYLTCASLLPADASPNANTGALT